MHVRLTIVGCYCLIVLSLVAIASSYWFGPQYGLLTTFVCQLLFAISGLLGYRLFIDGEASRIGMIAIILGGLCSMGTMSIAMITEMSGLLDGLVGSKVNYLLCELPKAA